MRIRFSWKVTFVCGSLAALMIRASIWQKDRYFQKQALIQSMESRLQQAPVPLTQVLDQIRKQPEEYLHRRVEVRGEYDFGQEVILRNRRYRDMPGVYSITPLKIDGSETRVLVNRGFIPLSRSKPEQRKEFLLSRQSESASTSHARFIGLVKPSSPRRFLGPKDPETGPGLARLDAWLWFDIERMSQQLPYSVLPVSLEIIEEQNLDVALKNMVQAKSGRDDMFVPTEGMVNIQSPDQVPNLPYPLPVFDPVVPPGRHFSYIFEWAFMALLTLAIGFILQLDRRGPKAPEPNR